MQDCLQGVSRIGQYCIISALPIGQGLASWPRPLPGKLGNVVQLFVREGKRKWVLRCSQQSLFYLPNQVKANSAVFLFQVQLITPPIQSQLCHTAQALTPSPPNYYARFQGDLHHDSLFPLSPRCKLFSFSCSFCSFPSLSVFVQILQQLVCLTHQIQSLCLAFES